MIPQEPSLLGQLGPDAYVVEIAALLDALGAEHDTVRLGIPRSKAALFVQDLRLGLAARGVVRCPAEGVFLPDHVEATTRTQSGVHLQVTGAMARAIAHDLEAGRRIRLGLPALSSTPRPILVAHNRSAHEMPHDRLPPRT